jgi:hypothetical protein
MITPDVRAAMRVLLVVAAVAVSVVLFAPSAGAAPAMTQPTESPYQVAVDAQGRPVPFTVEVSGFPFRTAVFVEQCDGQPTTAPNWSPTIDCDLASARAPVYADAHGVARFDASDSRRGLNAFSGPSPQGIFNCLPPNAQSPKNGLADFRNCQIRVSSNPTQITTEQVMLPIVLGAGGSSSSGSSHTALWMTLGVVAVLVVVAVVVVSSRRRAPSR